MSVIRCPACENTVDSDTQDCVEHPLSGELVCCSCANDLADILDDKFGMTMDKFRLICDLVKEFG